MKNRFMETLGLHQARDCGDHIVFELPLVLDFNYQLLTLQIYPLDEDRGYYIPPERLSLTDGIKFLRAIGAVPILAHPLKEISHIQLDNMLPNTTLQ